MNYHCIWKSGSLDVLSNGLKSYEQKKKQPGWVGGRPQVPLRPWLLAGFVPNSPELKSLLRFSQTCELKSSKAAFTIAFFTAVNHNYDHKQQTLKYRNIQNGSKSTNHKPWSFEPVKVKFCFLRGPLRWLTAAKNAIVSWLLSFRIRMFVKSAVTTLVNEQLVQSCVLAEPNVACEYSCFFLLLTAKDVLPRETSKTQWQTFQTNGVKSVRNLVRSSDWSM